MEILTFIFWCCVIEFVAFPLAFIVMSYISRRGVERRKQAR